jgi:hypothetical protein
LLSAAKDSSFILAGIRPALRFLQGWLMPVLVVLPGVLPATLQAPMHYVPISAQSNSRANNPATAKGVQALELNPAGLSQEGTLLGLDHNVYLENIQRTAASLAYEVDPKMGFGVRFSQTDYGRFDRFDEDGQSQGNFQVRDLELGLALARHFKGFSAGLGLAGRSEDAEDGFKAQPFLSLGLSTQWKGLALGGMWDRSLLMGSDTGMFRVGAAFSVFKSALLEASAGLAQEEKEAGAGISNTFGLVDLQVGWVRQWPDTALGWGDGLRGGFGIHNGPWRLDYALGWFGDYGATHHLGLGYQLGANSAPAKAALAQIRPASTLVRTPDRTPLATPVPVSQTAEVAVRLISTEALNARQLEQRGDTSAALQAWRQMAAKDPRDAEAWRGMARAYTALGRPDYAKTCWQSVLNLSPQDPQALQALPPPGGKP